MKRIAITAFVILAAAAWLQAKDSRAADFNYDWRFCLIDDEAASKEKYNDSQWRTLALPHDWAIEGDFSESNPSGTGGGALPGGIGWYRKTFTLPAADKGKQVYVDFDGVYMNSTVYVNGHVLGIRPYGYSSFSYDITPYVKFGKENVIAVKVDNSDQPNSRWYSGCGIYRNVWLRTLDPLHVAKDGMQVSTPEVSPYEAVVDIALSLEGADGQKCQVETAIFDPQGRKVAEGKIDVDGAEAVSQRFDIKRPSLWTVGMPNLYTATSTIVKDGKAVDEYSTRFGIRFFDFDADKGFSLNGQPMKINGVCLHHDLGALGAAINTRAIQRQLEIMREMGVNAIRCSHNPPSPELLDLCDEMGLLVMDEAFDMWRKRKTERDYARFFDAWHERDLTDLIVRDRNHPSVIMWSIGNEVLEQWTDASADTLSLEQANMVLNFGHSADMLVAENNEGLTVNSLLTKKLADMTRSLDPTRPITSGCNEPSPNSHLFKSGAIDIIGYNYHEDWFKDVPSNFPGKPFIITESISDLATRGYYRMPSDSMYIWPARWDLPFEDPSFQCSSYDNCHVPWGSTHEKLLGMIRDNDFISGQFIWTGFDYIGEPTPYGWPARSSYFGIVDLAGFPKDAYYLYQSEWRPDKQVLHLFPHWNWEAGEDVDLWCYYNNADEVELFVNGQSQGVRAKGPDDFHVMWRVPFSQGAVKAVARRGGKVVAEQEIKTAGDPYAIRLTPDRCVIANDGRDLSYVTVEIVDKDGNLCPWAENLVNFEVKGAGFNAGVDNGCQTSLERFKAEHRRAFYGKAMLIVQNNGEAGDITVAATSDGLAPATATITSK